MMLLQRFGYVMRIAIFVGIYAWEHFGRDFSGWGREIRNEEFNLMAAVSCVDDGGG
jgi:hypothetical protein